MTDTICLATNHLSMTESVRQTWVDLNYQLEARGNHLVLLSTVPAEGSLPFPVIPIPSLIRDFLRVTTAMGSESAVIGPTDRELLENDSSRAGGAYSAAEAIPGLLACRRFVRALLQNLQPGLVLAWDSTSPMAQILHSACVEMGFPSQYLDRGLLPETLMVESRGTMGLSDVRAHWLAHRLPCSAYNLETFERIRAYYLARKPLEHEQPPYGAGGAELRRSLGLQNKRAVVFFGHHDLESPSPAANTHRSYHSPGFASTDDFLMSLSAEVQRRPQTTLLFNPHPLDTDSHVTAEKAGIRIVRNVNLHALIEASDVVAAQFTTSQFEAVLYDKPILLAACSPWWGRNATYEVPCKNDLGSALDAALKLEGWSERFENARAFITWLMDSWLIGRTSEVPTRNRLADFARFITSTSLLLTELPPPKDRIKTTLEQFVSVPAHRPSSPARTHTETPSAPQSADKRPAPLTAAKTLLVENKLEAAVAAARCAVRERPGCEESVAVLAEALFRSGTWNQAAEQYQLLTRLSRDNRDYWHRRWECSVRQDHSVLAELILDEALALHPEWAGTWKEMEAQAPVVTVSDDRPSPLNDNTSPMQVEGRYAFE
jgi:tetratricopeptide (TPR) repeat protein